MPGENFEYHSTMRKFDSPYIADWFAISLRWIMLVGLLVSVSLDGGLVVETALPILLLLLWNVGMTALAVANTRLAYHRQINLLVDLALMAAFFQLQGGVAGRSSWAFLLPIFTGSVYFEFWGALGAAVVFAAVEVAAVWLQESSRAGLMPAAALAVVTLGLGLLFGFLGRSLMNYLRGARVRQLQDEEKRWRVQSERLRAIYELTSTLNATLSYKRVLDSALDMGYAALNPDPETDSDQRLVSAVLLFKGDKLRVGSARRFTNADQKIHLQGSEGLLKRIFDEGEPILSNDIGYDPELGRIIALRTCTTAYCFPLRSGFNVYGAMLFAHPDPYYFTPDRVSLLDIIGRQAVIAIQNARLYQDLLEEKNRMVEVHEEARKKLARDLHDGPTQSVAAMAMRINLARRMMERNTQSAKDEMIKIEELAHRTTKEIRHMLFTLRPLILESQGLTAALQSMAEKVRETFSQNVVVNIDEKLVKQLEMGKQGVIFYIIEEAVNNARKHANAANIWVNLKPFETGIAVLEILDDGIGFDVKAVNQAYDKRGSLGMINLRERAELVNGLLNIDSAPGKGTRVQVYIPLSEEAADRLHHKK
ncbi:MAG: GAF domain-containing sensor histidine kinase [Chloroflexota bacterium]